MNDTILNSLSGITYEDISTKFKNKLKTLTQKEKEELERQLKLVSEVYSNKNKIAKIKEQWEKMSPKEQEKELARIRLKYER